MIVNVLGTEYTIEIKKYAEDEAFERCSIDGYCDWLTKKIVVCDGSMRQKKPFPPLRKKRSAMK